MVRRQTGEFGGPLLLFDGVCNLCNWAVQFIIARDPAAHIRFASLQSDMGRQVQSDYKMDNEMFDSVVLVYNGRTYTESTAVLMSLRWLRWPWPMASAILRVVPRSLRDIVYHYVAKRRYQWFGKRAQCMVPSPDIARRFLDDL